MLTYHQKMKNYNTKKEFVQFCRNNWYKKKDVEWIYDLLLVFIKDSLINWWKVSLHWFASFYISETTSTLFPWRIFKKVKVTLSKPLTYMFNNKKW